VKEAVIVAFMKIDDNDDGILDEEEVFEVFQENLGVKLPEDFQIKVISFSFISIS